MTKVHSLKKAEKRVASSQLLLRTKQTENPLVFISGREETLFKQKTANSDCLQTESVIVYARKN